MRRARTWTLIGLLWMVAAPAAAQQADAQAEAEADQDEQAPEELDTRGDLFVSAGVDAWSAATPNGHGYGLLSYQREDIWRELDVNLTYNTDTILARGSGLQLGEQLRLGGFVKGQVLYAGLLRDYYRRGEERFERAFNASYVQGGLFLDAGDGPFFLQVGVSTRRWFFSERQDFFSDQETAEGFVLPSEMWVIEPRMRLTYWDFEHDPSHNEPHRHFWRLSGWGLGAEFGPNIRFGWRQWGAFDEEVFEQPDRRNLQGAQPFIFRGWLRWGLQFTDWARVQTKLFASLGINEDDLTRSRVGGLNPYVVQMGGLPWAAYLPENFGSAEATFHFKVFGDSEVGPMVQALQMSEADATRANFRRNFNDPNDGLGASLYSVGLFGDWRFGDSWQIYTRFGYTLPNDHLLDGPYLSGFIGLGTQLF